MMYVCVSYAVSGIDIRPVLENEFDEVCDGVGGREVEGGHAEGVQGRVHREVSVQDHLHVVQGVLTHCVPKHNLCSLK